MPSPGSCSRCRQPLAVQSDSELCLACRRAAVADPTGPSPPPAYLEPTRSPGPDPDPGDFSPDPDRFRPEPPPGYEFIRCLGVGGMGTVYLARELAAERIVALKLLNAPSSPTAVERFLVEARALARLDHPHIIQVIAVELNWREPFLTMEYADGGSLADLCVPDCLLPPVEAVRLVLAATEAVAAAHAADVLHRDLKPSNILLKGVRGQESGDRGQETSGGPASLLTPVSCLLTPVPCPLTPVVSDFGLAKRTDRDDGLTRTGPIGTPRYMSPEAAAGRFQKVGPPADVYGLGATLYHLLTGRPPFEGDGPTEVIRKVIHDPLVRPRAIRPEVPAELEAIVIKAMEKEPVRRYPTANARAADLRRYLAGDAPTAPLLSPRRRAGRWLGRQRTRIAAVVAVLVLAFTLVAAGRYVWPEPRTTDAEQQIRTEIAGGKPVRLLKADGRPRFEVWPLGQDETKAKPDDDGTFAFGSPGVPRVLILLNDPGVDSYRLSAELRQEQKVGTVQERRAGEVGLALGYADQPGTGATRVHTLMALQFSDFDPDDEPDVRRVIALTDYGLVSPDWLSAKNFPMVHGVPVANLDRPAGWRTISVDVSPAGVKVPGPGGQAQLADVVGINQRRQGPGENIQDKVSQTAGPVVLPAWTPRMPVGIWCRGSWVAVRNVTIERLP